MKVLIKTNNLTREEWLKWRTKGIGGSDVTWKQITSTSFDRKRLEKEHKEIYDAYVMKNQYRRLYVA